MPRASGFVVFAVLVLAIVAFRTGTSQRARRLLAGEESARHVVAELHRAARAELDAGRPLPPLAHLLGAVDGLRELPEVGDERIEYARDARYTYGYARVFTPGPDRASSPGYVLRAWPWMFGVTGDTEWHVSQDGLLHEGQNILGRSGVERAFPPPFPDPEVGSETSHWWPRPLPGDE